MKVPKEQISKFIAFWDLQDLWFQLDFHNQRLSHAAFQACVTYSCDFPDPLLFISRKGHGVQRASIHTDLLSTELRAAAELCQVWPQNQSKKKKS